MIESTFKQFVKKNNFRLIFFVLVGLFVSENGFAPKNWIREYVLINLVANTNCIVITIRVYNYPFGPNSEHGYLENCFFEASVDNVNYIGLMDIHTQKQNRSNKTEIIFKNKLYKALIIFTNDFYANNLGLIWPENLSLYLPMSISNHGYMSVVRLKWNLDNDFRDVRYIRISGKWQVPGRAADFFREIVYNLNIPNQSTLISNTPDTITKESEKDTVHILKDSEAIVIKGADLGANIKVYNTAGVELQSTVSKRVAVGIKLPAKQIYIVQIGKSRYKVAM